MSWFWPIVTGVTFFDVWTIFHFAFWLFVTSGLWAIGARKWRALLFCFLISLAWEVFESVAFVQWPEIWMAPESWMNSWISDPLTCPVGFFSAWALLDAYARRKR